MTTISNYMKIEELKQMLIFQMKTLGMLEQTQTINEEDLDIMIRAMAKLNQELTSTDKEDKVNYLVSYIIGLWGRLIVDYGAKLEEL